MKMKMKTLNAFLRDGRRSQRGSVLSGVLIITAFLAIISGALMTTLSANFLLSRDLMNRVANEATVNSAMELALDSIQHAPFNSACPSLNALPSLNGRNATVSYLSCALIGPTTQIPASAPINFDGAYEPASGEYLVVDSAGTLYGYRFGMTAGWSYSTGGAPTAPAAAVSDGRSGVSDLIPGSYSNVSAVRLAHETAPGQAPSFLCDMVTDGAIVSAPGASRNAAAVAYVGDSTGSVFAFDASATGNCAERGEPSIAVNRPIVAGPIVFPGTTSSSDRLFVVASDGSASTLEQYRYSGNSPNLTLISTLALPYPNAVGMAAATLNPPPAMLAITFSGGQVAVVQVSAGFNMSLTAETGAVPGGVSRAPSWCAQCLPAGIIAVGSQSGIYLFDSNLNLYASQTGTAMPTSPAADGGGDWFAGGSNGTLYELRPATGGQMVIAKTFPAAAGAVTSSPVARPCGRPLCVYFGAADANAYLISLDARDAVLSACLTSTQGSSSCSGANPRLWAQVEIGAPGNAEVVHVQGFSYYSP
jgi:hypothetical protein